MEEKGVTRASSWTLDFALTVRSVLESLHRREVSSGLSSGLEVLPNRIHGTRLADLTVPMASQADEQAVVPALGGDRGL